MLDKTEEDNDMSSGCHKAVDYLLDKMLFCHLNNYCRSNTAVDIARILKVSTSPAGIKYKFGNQVSKGIKNAIDLEKKEWKPVMARSY
jgi:hypothetical protein